MVSSLPPAFDLFAYLTCAIEIMAVANSVGHGKTAAFNARFPGIIIPTCHWHSSHKLYHSRARQGQHHPSLQQHIGRKAQYILLHASIRSVLHSAAYTFAFFTTSCFIAAPVETI
jgi:hypothetical protein